MNLLEIRDLDITYQTRKGALKAVEGLSLSLSRGKSLGLVGESGCGKTTIGKALMGILPPNGSITSGSVLFEGTELTGLSEEAMKSIRWKRISMIFQAAMNALNPVHRVGDQIAEAILTHFPETVRQEAFERVKELFEFVGIPLERINDYPHQYSGGMKQRAIIAMALSCRPGLVIADEPTTALDVIVQDQILKEIKSLQEEFDIGIIFISHDISIVADVCHDIAVMYAGQIVEYGRVNEVFDEPVHPYTKALLESFPTLGRAKSRLMPISGDSPNLINPPPACRFCQRCTGAIKACSLEAPEWVDITPTHRARCGNCR